MENHMEVWKGRRYKYHLEVSSEYLGKNEAHTRQLAGFAGLVWFLTSRDEVWASREYKHVYGHFDKRQGCPNVDM